MEERNNRKNERKIEGRKMVDLLSPYSDFSVYECHHLCFLHGSIPFWASSISDSPEGQPTDIYISKTCAWLPEPGMLKTPRLAFSRLPTLAALPPVLRKGSRQVRTDP